MWNTPSLVLGQAEKTAGDLGKRELFQAFYEKFRGSHGVRKAARMALLALGFVEVKVSVQPWKLREKSSNAAQKRLS